MGEYASITPDLSHFDNFYPLTKLSQGGCLEGFWYCSDEPACTLYPYPKATDVKVDPAFLEKLEAMIHSINCGRIGASTMLCGYSTCRLCHKDNGSMEYFIRGRGQSFFFPEGGFEKAIKYGDRMGCKRFQHCRYSRPAL